MNNNLRPEVRVNKNGVPVTKHVRNAQAEPKKSLLSVLSPSLGRKHSERATRKKLIAFIDDDLAKYGCLNSYRKKGEEGIAFILRGDEIKFVSNTLSQYSTEGLARISDMLQTEENRDEKERIANVLVSSGSTERDALQALNFRKVVKDPLNFFLISKGINDALYDDAVLDAVEGTQEHDTICRLITSAQYIWANLASNKNAYTRDKYVSMDKGLAEVVLDHPDREDDIVSYFDERATNPHSISSEALRSYLETPASALRDGSL